MTVKRLRAKEVRKEGKRSSKLLIGAAIATIIVLVLGFLLGNQIATSRIEQFQDFEEMLLVQLIALDFRENMIDNLDVCNLEWKDIWETKLELGNQLTALERRLGKDNDKLKTKKEIYELIEIKTINILEKIRENCYEDFHIILLFYTNEKNDPLGSVAGSEDQGLILDQVYNDHNKRNIGSNVYIFVFNINSKNAATRALIQQYGIDHVPSIVIDGKKYDYSTKEQIEEYLS